MQVVWDSKKAATNLHKHQISFEEASSVFLDPLSITGADPEHSVSEARWITFGLSVLGRVLTAAHTDEGDTIRIISARVATRAERRLYEEDS